VTTTERQFSAVLFDADGTLLDSLQDLADSMNDTLAHHGFPSHEIDKYKYFVGDGMENLVIRSLPDAARADSDMVRQCLEMMRDNYGRNWKNKTRPYPGVPRLLDELSRQNIKMAILSNKPDNFMQQVVVELLPSWRFEIVMGERPPIPRKPDPTSARLISDMLGISPDRFLYLGDTATDMLTAKGAGMFGVGALWGFRTAEELLSSGARKLISDPRDLIDLVWK
jgi:phosphoglycolate phosphatase